MFNQYEQPGLFEIYALKVLICHVAYRYPGGEDVVFENEKTLLQKAGVDVISLSFHNEALKDSTWLNLVSIGIDTVWSKHGYRCIAEAIQEEQPDVVHFHNTFPLLSPSVYVACKDAGVPVVQTLHNFRLICANAMLYKQGEICDRCVGRVPVSALFNRCYRDSLAATAAVVAMQMYHHYAGTYRSYVDCYLALTSFAKSKLVLGGVPEARIAVKPNFLPAPPAPCFDVGDYALFVGRISEEKGVKVLFDAWAKIDGLPLLVAGDGPLLSDLRQREMVTNGKVRMLGYQSKESVQSLMAASAFVVIPSVWYEGFPMVVLEAFALGKPVICSRLGGLDEVVSHNTTGIKFITGDSSDLAEVVNELVRDNQLLQQMGKAARDEFESKYTADIAEKELLSLYEQILAAKK